MVNNAQANNNKPAPAVASLLSDINWIKQVAHEKLGERLQKEDEKQKKKEDDDGGKPKQKNKAHQQRNTRRTKIAHDKPNHQHQHHHRTILHHFRSPHEDPVLRQAPRLHAQPDDFGKEEDLPEDQEEPESPSLHRRFRPGTR